MTRKLYSVTQMDSSAQIGLIKEILDRIAEASLSEDVPADRAVERFSAAVDRLIGWLPPILRQETLLLARSHSYCSPAEIQAMRLS
jgi:hypothetical protein